jgi:hypothetical protein
MRGETRIPPRFLLITVLAVFASALLSSTFTHYTTKNALRATILKENKLAKTSYDEGDKTSAESVLSMCTALVQKNGNTAGQSSDESSRRDSKNLPPCQPQSPPPSVPAPPPNDAAKAAAPSVPNDSAVVPLIQFPDGIKNVIINIGTNYNPLMPPEDDPSTIVLAGEPSSP